VQLTDPISLYEPALQSRQADAEVIPTTVLKVPAGHGVQAEKFPKAPGPHPVNKYAEPWFVVVPTSSPYAPAASHDPSDDSDTLQPK